jgi:hypothetical protein
MQQVNRIGDRILSQLFLVTNYDLISGDHRGTCEHTGFRDQGLRLNHQVEVPKRFLLYEGVYQALNSSHLLSRHHMGQPKSVTHFFRLFYAGRNVVQQTKLRR